MDLGSDPTLRAVVKAARAWGVSPSRFLGSRPETPEWTEQDRQLALALEEYEAGLCPGCSEPLDETSRADHSDAYRPEPPIRCHYCTAQAMVNEAAQEQEHSAGLLIPLKLDLEIVELNRQPVPPLPPELQGLTDGDER